MSEQELRIIKIDSCQSCPYHGTCDAWKKLPRQQKVALTIGISAPHKFILMDCHLETMEQTP